jgi:hypothetical protein
VLVNASVFVPLTSFTMTSLTGLSPPPAPPEEGERVVTRPVTRTCADADTVSTANNIMYSNLLFLFLHKLSLIDHKFFINHFVLN